jgi:hypothetical protein
MVPATISTRWRLSTLVSLLGARYRLRQVVLAGAGVCSRGTWTTSASAGSSSVVTAPRWRPIRWWSI